MNKTDTEILLQQLKTLEAEAAALREIIEEPVEKKPLIYGQRGIIDYCDYAQSQQVADAYAQSQQVADAYAEAFNTMLDLRRQPGSEAAVDGKDQWSIDYDGEVFCMMGLFKTARIAPLFDSRESALAAKETVGWDRIERMMNTLHGRIE